MELAKQNIEENTQNAQPRRTVAFELLSLECYAELTLLLLLTKEVF